jgi:hypothetical protein
MDEPGVWCRIFRQDEKDFSMVQDCPMRFEAAMRVEHFAFDDRWDCAPS